MRLLSVIDLCKPVYWRVHLAEYGKCWAWCGIEKPWIIYHYLPRSGGNFATLCINHPLSSCAMNKEWLFIIYNHLPPVTGTTLLPWFFQLFPISICHDWLPYGHDLPPFTTINNQLTTNQPGFTTIYIHLPPLTIHSPPISPPISHHLPPRIAYRNPPKRSPAFQASSLAGAWRPWTGKA